MDREDIAAYRRMTPEQRLARGLGFIRRVRQFKIESVRIHHSGWCEEKVMNEVRRWVRDGMKPEELYEVQRRLSNLARRMSPVGDFGAWNRTCHRRVHHTITKSRRIPTGRRKYGVANWGSIIIS
jgi:hypothetical protein